VAFVKGTQNYMLFSFGQIFAEKIVLPLATTIKVSAGIIL
jgi:hypothetical protein